MSCRLSIAFLAAAVLAFCASPVAAAAPSASPCNDKQAISGFFNDWCDMTARNASTTSDFYVLTVFANGTSIRRPRTPWIALLSYLCASFPDFNLDYKARLLSPLECGTQLDRRPTSPLHRQGDAVRHADGWYYATLQHNGHFTGAPFSPPGSTLPKLQPTDAAFSTVSFTGRVLVDPRQCKAILLPRPHIFDFESPCDAYGATCRSRHTRTWATSRRLDHMPYIATLPPARPIESALL